MKTVPLILFFFSSIFLLSCQKEISVEELSKPNGNNNSSCDPNSLLIKTVSRTGPGSITTNYEYDAARRLIRDIHTGTFQGSEIIDERKIVRDTDGFIIKLIYKGTVITQNGYDSTYVNVFHDAATGRYTHTMQDHPAYGQILKDSIVFVYDGAGNIVRMDAYSDLLSGGTSWQLNDQWEYNFNTTTTKMLQTAYSHSTATGQMELNGTMTVDFDNKINPMQLSLSEAMVLTMSLQYSTHNQTSIVFNYTQVPDQNRSYATTYTYNSCNKPVTAVQTINPDNVVSNIGFYYQ